MPIFKNVSFDSHFTQITNELLQNEELSYEAKGLLCELLSRPRNWKVVKEQLYRETTGEKKLNRIFKELRFKGYLYLSNVRNKDNTKIIDRVWFVSHSPLSVSEWKKKCKKCL